jgi:hypothetical protein
MSEIEIYSAALCPLDWVTATMASRSNPAGSGKIDRQSARILSRTLWATSSNDVRSRSVPYGKSSVICKE